MQLMNIVVRKSVKLLLFWALVSAFFASNAHAGVFAPLQPVPEPEETEEQPVDNPEVQINNEEPAPADYGLFPGLQYYGVSSPVVETRTLQGGTTVLRRETKLMEGKLMFMGGDLPIKLRPAQIISTANPLLKAGDTVEFVVAEDVFHDKNLVVKKGTKVTGLILSLVENTYHGAAAEITIGQFEIKEKGNRTFNIKGVIEKKGSTHEKAINNWSYIIGPAVFWIRGGETKLSPEKDQYTLYIGDYAQTEETPIEGL